MTTWKRCTEARYDEMLGCLPPRVMTGRGFLVGEPFNHRRCKETGHMLPTYEAFVQINGVYFEGPTMTMPEWRALEADKMREAIHAQG